MSWEYSENILVQNSAGNVLETRLGWDVVFAYNTEVLGESGTLGRKTYHDIVLTRYLKLLSVATAKTEHLHNIVLHRLS